MHLSAHESKPGSQFKKEALDMVHQRFLHLSLTPRVGSAKKVEEIRIFKYLDRHIRGDRGQCRGEICNCFAMTFVSASFDLDGENISAPTVLNGFSCILQPVLPLMQFFEQGQIVVPRNLCKNLLHNCSVSPGRGKSAHVLKAICK